MNKDPSTENMGVIVQTVARWLKGFILVYGIYVALFGHITPGGGFEGGIIVACAFILPALAGGFAPEQADFKNWAASILKSAGILLFLALAVMGIWMAGGAFFQNFIGTSEEARFTLFSGGIIPLANIGIGLLVASSLFLVFAVLAASPTEPSSDRRDEVKKEI